MQTITSAYANKMLKSLEEDKAFWVNKEAASSTYVAAINEEPVIPEYDYSEVASMITAIDEKIAIIKHALNVTNATAKVQVGNSEMSIDTILIKMAQLNKRKGVLDQMRKQLPKSRQEHHRPGLLARRFPETEVQTCHQLSQPGEEAQRRCA